MNGLSGIRAINNNNVPVKAVRYQRQYKGNQWAVFDSWTAGWGLKSSDVLEVDAEVDRLNGVPLPPVANGTARIPTSNVVAQAQDLNENLRKA